MNTQAHAMKDTLSGWIDRDNSDQHVEGDAADLGGAIRAAVDLHGGRVLPDVVVRLTKLNKLPDGREVDEESLFLIFPDHSRAILEPVWSDHESREINGLNILVSVMATQPRETGAPDGVILH